MMSRRHRYGMNGTRNPHYFKLTFQIRHALSFLAEHAPPTDSTYKKSGALGAFLKHHILGLVARFSEVVNDARDGKPTREKKKCIKAIDEMVKLGKSATRTARPHVCFIEYHSIFILTR